MSRCKACDAVLSEGELAMTNAETGEPEDLCLTCLGHAYGTLVEDEDDWLPEMEMPDDDFE